MGSHLAVVGQELQNLEHPQPVLGSGHCLKDTGFGQIVVAQQIQVVQDGLNARLVLSYGTVGLLLARWLIVVVVVGSRWICLQQHLSSDDAGVPDVRDSQKLERKLEREKKVFKVVPRWRDQDIHLGRTSKS